MTERRSDQAARERAIQALGSVLVQAPAGSGKTTLLVQRYLRLLARVDAPECILALTFTRRAAQEMRERVLSALEAAGRGQCPQNMNRETWNLALSARRHLDASRLDMERQPSRLRIETIDAFNAWLAGQLPIAAGAGSAFQVLADASHCYQEAARRALARESDDQFGVAVDRVLALDDQRWKSLLKLIAAMLPGRDRWLPLLAGRLQAASALDEHAAAGVARTEPRLRCLGRGANRRLVGAGARRRAAHARGTAGPGRVAGGRCPAARRECRSRAMAWRCVAAADRGK
jgi:ATP-dependent exoDNAse (exonuclease V) beta subunit